MPGARLSRPSAVRRLQLRSSANAIYEASFADRLSRSSQTRSSSENTGYRVIPRCRKASRAVHPESVASCSAATMRRSPFATSESMRCGACSCSLARALLAGPALSSADSAAEASTTITCRHVQHLGRAESSRRSHRNRASCRATQGCRLCATPQQVPLPLLPLPMWRRELRAAPNARRRHPARSSSKAFSCRSMLAKILQKCQGTIHCGTGLISHARGPTDQGRESDGDPARPCTRSATGSLADARRSRPASSERIVHAALGVPFLSGEG